MSYLMLPVCVDEADCFNNNRDFWATDSLVDLSIWGDDTAPANVPSNCTLIYSNGTVLSNGTISPNGTAVSNGSVLCDRAIPSEWGIDDQFKCQV